MGRGPVLRVDLDFCEDVGREHVLRADLYFYKNVGSEHVLRVDLDFGDGFVVNMFSRGVTRKKSCGKHLH